MKLFILTAGLTVILLVPAATCQGQEGQWIQAGYLKNDIKLVNSKGEQISISSIEILQKETTVFNLEVSDWNTYHVSKDELIVHNQDYKAGQEYLERVKNSLGTVTEVGTIEKLLGFSPGSLKEGDYRFVPHHEDPDQVVLLVRPQVPTDGLLEGAAYAVGATGLLFLPFRQATPVDWGIKGLTGIFSLTNIKTFGDRVGKLMNTLPDATISINTQTGKVTDINIYYPHGRNKPYNAPPSARDEITHGLPKYYRDFIPR